MAPSPIPYSDRIKQDRSQWPLWFVRHLFQNGIGMNLFLTVFYFLVIADEHWKVVSPSTVHVLTTLLGFRKAVSPCFLTIVAKKRSWHINNSLPFPALHSTEKDSAEQQHLKNLSFKGSLHSVNTSEMTDLQTVQSTFFNFLTQTLAIADSGTEKLSCHHPEPLTWLVNGCSINASWVELVLVSKCALLLVALWYSELVPECGPSRCLFLEGLLLPTFFSSFSLLPTLQPCPRPAPPFLCQCRLLLSTYAQRIRESMAISTVPLAPHTYRLGKTWGTCL